MKLENWPTRLYRHGHQGKSWHREGTHLCMLQAINWIQHQETSDIPECVNYVDRNFLRCLNDRFDWSGDATRSNRLRPIAEAVVGTDKESSNSRSKLWIEIYEKLWFRFPSVEAPVTDVSIAFPLEPTICTITEVLCR